MKFHKAEDVEKLVEVSRRLRLGCANTGYYGPMGIKPGECECACCDFNRALSAFQATKPIEIAEEFDLDSARDHHRQNYVADGLQWLRDMRWMHDQFIKKLRGGG